MSNKSNLLISILVFLLGGVFCWLCESPTLSEKILFLGGLAFLLPALLSLLGLFFTKKGQEINAIQRVIQLICGVAGVVLGLCVLLMPDFFRSLLGFMFGALLIAGAAWQLFLLTRKGRRSDYAAWTTVAPVICLVAGVLMITMPWFRNELNERYMVLTTGIGFLLFGITGFIISCWRTKEASAARRAKLAAKAEAKAGAESASATADAARVEPSAEKAAGTEEPSVSGQGVDTVSTSEHTGDKVNDSIH